MESINICYIVVALLVILNIIVIYISVKCSYRVDDDFEYIDENGDHVYYDRKLIREKESIARRRNFKDTV
ncbi:MAG: hypothetical protein SNI32_07860 [Rikenellaceae bacterium]